MSGLRGREGFHFFFPVGANSMENTGISSDLLIIQSSRTYQVSKPELLGYLFHKILDCRYMKSKRLCPDK